MDATRLAPQRETWGCRPTSCVHLHGNSSVLGPFRDRLEIAGQ
jgi:hypothetical protein